MFEARHERVHVAVYYLLKSNINYWSELLNYRWIIRREIDPSRRSFTDGHLARPTSTSTLFECFNSSVVAFPILKASYKTSRAISTEPILVCSQLYSLRANKRNTKNCGWITARERTYIIIQDYRSLHRLNLGNLYKNKSRNHMWSSLML